MSACLSRREFGRRLAATTGIGLAATGGARAASPSYTGPNVIIVRFGGGVRRRETIDPKHSYSPYLVHELIPRGTLFRDMRIAQGDGIATGHGHGTLYILTGRYDRYVDQDKIVGDRFEPKAPTLFEYLRRAFDVPAHQALIVNGEDRIDEEFYTFSTNHMFGVRYRSTVLSLYRYKIWLLRRRIAEGGLPEPETARLSAQLRRLVAAAGRSEVGEADPALDRFWSGWRGRYGDSGLVNPRGDRLLTALALRALSALRPKLMMVNYQDPDYVHWGNAAHYTRAIAAIDDGLREIANAIALDPAYRDNTVLAVLPDCGRDDNRLMAVPFQHHFGSASARAIWALFLGPTIGRGAVIDRAVDQISVAPTIGRIMNMPVTEASGPVLAEAFR